MFFIKSLGLYFAGCNRFNSDYAAELIRGTVFLWQGMGGRQKYSWNLKKPP